MVAWEIHVETRCHWYWGAKGLEMRIRSTVSKSHIMGVKLEVLAGYFGQSEPKPVAFPKPGRGWRPRQGPGGTDRLLPSAWLLALVFAWWEFTLYLELASTFWQVWQSAGS